MAYYDGYSAVLTAEALTATCEADDCTHRGIRLVDGTLYCGTHAWDVQHGALVPC